MMGYLDRLKLRPAEKRLVVLVALALFVVANLLFVWPYFGAWNLANLRLEKAGKKLADYQKEVGQTTTYKQQLAVFDQENPEVPPEDQAIQFQRAIQTQAAQSGVNVVNFSRSSTRTNDAFFLEQLQTISVQTREKELVDFLYNLGAGQSLIRVREISLRPDQQHYTLGGNITLVASYQKKTAGKAPGAGSSTTAKPAANATPKPATAPAPLATAAKPPVVKPPMSAPATTPPASSGGLLDKVKGWFGGSPAPATLKTNAAPAAKPGALPASTNRTNPLLKPPGSPTATGAPAKTSN